MFLGTWITSDGRCTTEINTRTGQAKTAFKQMESILKNQKINIEVRKRVLKIYIEPILMYGSESWTITKATENKINATEMWFLCRMLRISYTDRITNAEVLKRAAYKRAMMTNIRKRQSKFFGHVMRRNKMEQLLTTGKIEGVRSRGRQRHTILDSLAEWMHADSTVNIIKETWDRDRWRGMTANATRHGT